MGGTNQNNSDKKILLRGEYAMVTQKFLLRGSMGGPNQNNSDKKSCKRGSMDGRPKWRMTKMEVDHHGRRPKWKTTKMEDDQNGR